MLVNTPSLKLHHPALKSYHRCPRLLICRLVEKSLILFKGFDAKVFNATTCTNFIINKEEKLIRDMNFNECI